MSHGASPDEIAELVSKQSFVYVDVSTEEQYADGHPTGALNVPLELHTRKGLEKNADFLLVFEKIFDKTERLLIGARDAAFAERAASLLRAAGYSNVTAVNADHVSDGVRTETITEGGSYPEMRWRAGLA